MPNIRLIVSSNSKMTTVNRVYELEIE